MKFEKGHRFMTIFFQFLGGVGVLPAPLHTPTLDERQPLQLT